jgi:dTDP-4-dehydrorhamnose reductase
MVGSHFLQHSRYPVHAAGRTDPRSLGLPAEGFSVVRLERGSEVERFVETRPEAVIVNFAARTDVDSVERERTASPTPSQGGEAWSINALAPGTIARGAQRSGKYFVQLSTDFVFDGTAGPYAETDLRSPTSDHLSWYGWTKGEGERRVEEENPTAGILRISYPFRSAFPRKLDFARALVAKHRAGTLPPLYTDQRFTPTWIPDATRALQAMMEARGVGIFHAASPETTTPYEFARRLLQRVSGAEPVLDRGSLRKALARPETTPRPVLGGLRCHRLAQLGVHLTGWREGIDLLVAEERWK